MKLYLAIFVALALWAGSTVEPARPLTPSVRADVSACLDEATDVVVFDDGSGVMVSCQGQNRAAAETVAPARECFGRADKAALFGTEAPRNDDELRFVVIACPVKGVNL